MFLSCLTEDAYDDLLNGISKNEEKYYGNDEWLDDFFVGRKYADQSTSVQVDTFELISQPNEQSDAEKSEEDLVNVRILHDAFKNLTPWQASNKYLWTYLCHADTKCREYIQNRWLLSSSHGQDPIKTRFFVTNTRSLIRENALSRLWWYGHLTYDESETDPYALTRILLTQQAIAADVLDTLNRRNPNRMKGVLLALRDFDEKTGGVSNFDKDYVRPCMHYLNRYAAVTNLDYLEPEEVRDIAYYYMLSLKE